MEQVIEREKWQNYEIPIDNTPLDTLLLKKQKYCVVQLAHAEASIKSSDQNPWLRCIAFCETLDSAYSVARNAFQRGDNMETRILPCGKCNLVPRNKRIKEDLDAMLKEQNKANAQFDAHVAQRTKIISEAKENVQDKALAQEQASIASIDPKDFKDFKAKDPKDPKKNTGQEISTEFGRPDEVFMQRFAAFAVIPDPDDSLREPVVIPLFAAECMESLSEIVKTVSNNVDLVHVDIFCGPLLEWLPLYKPKSEKTVHKHPLRQAFEEKIKWLPNGTNEIEPNASVPIQLDTKETKANEMQIDK
jgi:hypothetical protein